MSTANSTYQAYLAQQLQYEPNNGHSFVPAGMPSEPEGFADWIWDQGFVASIRSGGHMSEESFYMLSPAGENAFAEEIELIKNSDYELTDE